MKLRLIHTILIFALNIMNTLAQDATFNAMIFRSIINDENNMPIKSKKLVLNIELFSENTIWYKEKHIADTDQNGIVNLKIGNGKDKVNSFENIPWATKEIKIRINYIPELEISKGSQKYKSLETTCLYAVPYAFHALSANSLTSNLNLNSSSASTTATGSSNAAFPSKSEFWSAYGNRNIDMRDGFLGTVDLAPIVFKTNNLERLRISSDGVTTFNSPLIVPQPFYVQIDSLNVNKLKVNTLTNLNADFSKVNMNSTAQSYTINNGALVVKGGVGIAKNLNVGENMEVNGNVNIHGSMNFDDTVNFNNPIQTQSTFTINDTTESYKTDDGAFIVKGGVGIMKNVNIGGNTTINGNVLGNNNLAINNNVIIYGNQDSTTKDDGALLLQNGGLGVEKNLFIGGNITTNSSIKVDKNLNVALNSNLNTLIVNGTTQQIGVVTIDNNTISNNINEGALVVKGGVGIGDNVNIGKNLKVTENTAVLGALSSNSLAVNTNFELLGTQDATTKDTGALIVQNGGLGVEKNTFVGGNIEANGNINSGSNLYSLNNTNVGNNLNVINESNLNLVNINSTTNIKGITTIDNNTISNNTNQGAMVVKGGVGIGDNVNIGKNLKVTENTAVLGALSSNSLAVNTNFELLGTQDATTKDTGALIVQNGGLGVEKNTFVGGNIEANGNINSGSNLSSLNNTNVGNNLNVINESNLNLVNINSTTNIKGITTIDNNTISNNTNQGALVVKGGVGIGDNVNIGKNLKVTENTAVLGALSSNSLAVNTNFELLGTQDATTKDTGALIVQNGGLGVEKNTFVGGNIEANGNINSGSNLSSLNNTNVGNNLNVINESNLNLVNINSTTNIKGITKIDNNTISNNINEGAMVVKGGVGIGDNVNIGKNLKVTGFAHLLENTILDKTLQVNGITTLNEVLKIQSTADGIENKAFQVKGGALINGSTAMDGALKINSILNPAPLDMVGPASFKTDGGAIIAGNLNVGGAINNVSGLTSKKQVVIDVFDYYSDPFKIGLLDNLGYGRDLRYDSYALKINAVNQGIAIKVNRHDRSNFGPSYGDDDNQVVTTGNNFLSFWDNTGKMVGRVEGENLGELVDKNFTYVNKTDRKNVMIATRAIDITIIGIKDAMQAIKAQKATATYAAAAGLNSIITPTGIGSAPITTSKLSDAASKMTEEQAKLILETTNLVNKSVQFGLDISLVDADLENSRNKVGVKYSSASGDYAEYLELKNPLDANLIKWGNIVGVKGGKISLNTQDADKIMAISMSPAVIGNMPEDKDIKNFKPVAFMGQIPVIVINRAKIGDYVLPSGNNDGLAIAKSADSLDIEDYKKIIGVAWENSNNKTYINVAVGINSNDVVDLIKKQDTKLDLLENRINTLEKLILNKQSDQTTLETSQIKNKEEYYKTEFLTALDNSEENKKIITEIVTILTKKQIYSLKNKNIYIDRIINEYLGIYQIDFNKIDSVQQNIITAYVDAIKTKVLELY